MSLLTKTMNFISKPNLPNKPSNESSQPKIQSGPLVPSFIEVVSTSLKTNQSVKNTQFQPSNSQTVQNQSEIKKMTQTSQKESPKTIFLSRKNILKKLQLVNKLISKLVNKLKNHQRKMLRSKIMLIAKSQFKMKVTLI